MNAFNKSNVKTKSAMFARVNFCFTKWQGTWEAGAMAQQLRALVALAEDQGSVPITNMEVHNRL